MVAARPWERWKNRKNGHVYIVLFQARDSTNARDGNRVVVYENKNGDRFVRDLDEFLVKFERTET